MNEASRTITPTHVGLVAGPLLCAAMLLQEPSGGMTVLAWRTAAVGVLMAATLLGACRPAHALARRGIIENVVGYSVFGDYRDPNPPARLIDAVARGDIDVAVAWGPLAGYFAARQTEPLALLPVSPEIDLPFLPQVFDIAMGVRHGEFALRDRLDEVLERRAADIDAMLDTYCVPYTRRIRRANTEPVTP